jgi:phage-related protein
MAIVGSAEIIVKAITTGFKDDVKKQLSGLDGIGNDAGDSVGKAFSRGLSKGAGENVASILNIGNLVKEAESAKEAFANFQRQGFVTVSALTALGGAVGALIGGIGILGATVVAATPVLVGFGNIFAGLAVSAAVLKGVFSGVTEAIQAKAKALQDAAANAARVQDAEDRLNDASYAYLQVVKDQAQALKDLQERRNDAANALADANLSAERSERSYQYSVTATQKALDDVTLARQQAKEAIQQLRFELEGGVISEKKARLEFEKARESLQRVQDLPPNSRARREAEIAFSEADLNLRKAIDKNNDLRKSNAKATKDGVDGNKSVVASELAYKKAKDAQSDAEIDAAKAVRSVFEAKKELQKIDDQLAVGSERELKNLRELELAQRAVDRATRDLALAKKQASGNTPGLPVISPAAKDFVDYIIELKKKLTELKLLLQEAFFPKFTEAVKLLAETYLPKLKDLLPPIADALAQFALDFAKAFTTPQKVKEFETILGSIPTLIANYGSAVTDLASSFTTLTAEFTPYAVKFSAYVKDQAEALKNTIELKAKNGELKKIFDTATEIMYSLFRSMGNIFGTIGNIVSATFSKGGGGWYFLDWLEKVTQGWETFTKKADKNGTLDKYILGLSQNFTKILEIIGLVVKGMLDIGASPGFGKFLDSLKNATKTFNGIGTDIANGALPMVGKFIEKLATFISIVLDSGPIKAFFGVLYVAMSAVVALLDNDFMRAFMAGHGVIIGIGLAFGLLSKAAMFMGRVFVGAILPFDKLLALLPQTWNWVYKLRFAMLALAEGELALAAPILIVVAAIAAIIATLVLAYQKSEIFRKAIADLVSAVKTAISEGFDKIKAAIADALPFMDKMGNVFKWIGDMIGTYVVPIIKVILVGAINYIVDVIVAFIKVIGGIVGAFKAVWDGLAPIVTGIVNVVKGMVSKIGDIIGGIAGFFKNSFSTAVDAAKGILNQFITVYNNTLGKLKFTVPKWFPIGGGSTIGFPTITPLAMGGIVNPKNGGTLAQLAEAGKPERVEPLDPDGLSKRDKAMIQMLAGNNNAGNINITVNPSPGMDERELANLVSRQLAYQMRKGAA